MVDSLQYLARTALSHQVRHHASPHSSNQSVSQSVNLCHSNAQDKTNLSTHLVGNAAADGDPQNETEHHDDTYDVVAEKLHCTKGNKKLNNFYYKIRSLNQNLFGKREYIPGIVLQHEQISELYCCVSIIIIIINPLTVRVVRAPQMILQPVFSIFPCSPLPSGNCRTPSLSIP